MNIDLILNYFSQYGLVLLFLIVFLEYLNLPGLPAGIIMPAAGIMIARSNMNFILALIISIIAGLLGSIVLYIIGYYGGAPLLEKILKKYPKIEPSIEKTVNVMKKREDLGILICRVLPVVRTIVSAVAGVIKVRFWKFLISSTIGITIWNLGFILAGYLFGDWFLK